MATRVGLIRSRGHSCRAQLVHGQPQSSISGVRLLARLSSSSSRSTALKGSASASSSSAPLAFRPPTHRHQYPASSIFLGRRNSGSGGKALFLSTTSTRPTHEERAAQDSDPGHRSSSSSSSKPGRKTFDGGDNDDRLARLDDGDKYEDFFDLRLAEAETIFPEGLAGGGQGALERAMAGGTSTALLRREAADALIHSLDAFASEDGGAAPPFGIEGTSSENWRKASEARQYGSQQDGGGSSADAATAAAAASPDDGGHDDDGDDDDIIGDVTAAAAEGAAAAAAAAEAVQAAARAAAAAAAAAGGEGAGGEGPEQEGGGGGEDKKVLGSGPVWEEMKALAESKRKPLKGVRRVVIQPGQRSYLLTGRRGSGKSCVLNHAVLHARSTGWIVLFVPDGRNLVQKGIYCQPSPVLEELYDLPVQSMKRLKTLREAHGDQLKNISINDPEVLGRHEGAKTLLDVMDMGLADQEHAGTAHYDVMRELLATTEAKVMLAIDEYNELFQMSHWHYGDNKASACTPHLTATLPLLPPLVSTGTGLAFADDSVAALANPEVVAERQRTPAEARGVAWMSPETGAACLPPPPANGIVVCAVSGRYPPVKKLRKKKWVPFEATAGRLAQAVSIPVEPYTRREFLRVLKHYARVEEVVNEPLETMEVAKVHAKSDSLPEHVFDTCRAGRYRTAVHEQ
ncbi:unnamed protein product [Ectocarpus sp. 8 AP-2014]